MIETMKQALEALEELNNTNSHWWQEVDETTIAKIDPTITAIKQALAAPTQEPRCAVIVEVFGKDWRLDYMSLPVGKHRLYTQEYVYTTPPAAQREWVGLTEEEIFSVLGNLQRKYNRPPTEDSRVVFALAIEAKLKEKNT